MANAQQIALIVAEVLKALEKNQPKAESKVKSAKQTKPAYVKLKASKSNVSPKENRKLIFQIAAVKAAQKAGFANAEPHKTLLTYSKWTEQGLKPKAGSKAIKVPAGNGRFIPLFHVTQCEALAA